MKIMILGSTGDVGSELLEYFSKNTDYEIVATWRDDKKLNELLKNDLFVGRVNFENLDIRVLKNMKFWLEESVKIHNPDYIINCIHESSNEELTNCLQVNSWLPINLSKICQEKNIKLIHIANCDVYENECVTEHSECLSKSIVGMTKTIGELESKNAMILRVSRFITKKTSEVLLSYNEEECMDLSFGITTNEFGSICNQIIVNNLWAPELFHLVSRTNDGMPDPKIWSKKNLTFDLKIKSIEKQLEWLYKGN